jgi:hypothetical protein
MYKEKAKFKFSAILFSELEHKATIAYDNTPEEQILLDKILSKVLQNIEPKPYRYFKRIEDKQKICSSFKEYNDLEIAKYKKPFAYIEVTKDEFHTWYEGWFDFYLNSDYALPILETFSQYSWARNSNEKTAQYKEAKKLLNSMYKVFGKLELSEESKLLLQEDDKQTKQMMAI